MDAQQIVEIARLYYEHNISQDDIAQQLSISRSTVSRALKRAREQGYVRITIVSTSNQAPRLESWLYSSFNLEHVTIVPATGDYEADLVATAKVAALYLDYIVPSSGTVGVSGGRTLWAISEQVRLTQRPQLRVVPVMGGWVGASMISANEVVRQFSTRWGAPVELLFAPAFVSDALAREALLREEGIRRALATAKSADIACISAAPILPHKSEWQAQHASISEEDGRQLVALGAVGEVCAQFLKADGTPIDSWNNTRTLAVSIADYRKMRSVVMVGVGVEKAAPFLAACRSGFVTALIVTEDLAQEMEKLASST